MPRSESNPIAGKVTYTDLNLTNYPDAIDSRANNANMAGFTNLKDYNYAEHINALEDAVMAIQRALGIKPFLDKNSVSQGTVSDRIKAIENKDFDSRYGGSGWNVTQTLVGHIHTGGPGHPSQVNLVGEVQGQLAKSNMNLVYNAGGLTGADISMSTTDARKLADVVNDKLSVSQGGTIQGNLQVNKQFNSRTIREFDVNARSNGALVTDWTTMMGQAMRGTGTPETQFFNTGVWNLAYGKYVMGVRARVSAQPTEEVLHLRWYDLLNNGWNLKNNLYLKGTDFTAANQWQMFYLTFEHTGNIASSYGAFHVWKPTTATNLSVDIDNVFIMPTHPAIYDR